MNQKRQNKLPKLLIEEEEQELLKQPNDRYPTGQRNLAILKTFLKTGLRLSELTALKWYNVNLSTGELMVRDGKGHKDRDLGIPPSLIRELKDWRKRQKKEIGENTEYVFTTLDGTKLCNQYVQQMVNRYSEKAGIQKKISPHTLRHTFATRKLNQGVNIRVLQQALGHANLSSTMIYTHVSENEVKEAMRQEKSSTTRKKEKIEDALNSLQAALDENGLALDFEVQQKS